MSTVTPSPLDAATVVALHQMMLKTNKDRGVAVAAVSSRRVDVLEVLEASGELRDKAVAGACVVQAIAMRDAEMLNWLVSHGAEPCVVKPPASVSGRADNWPKRVVMRHEYLGQIFAKGDRESATWVEGLRILLDAGAIAPTDWITHQAYARPQSLLGCVLDSEVPEFALELIERGAVPEASLLNQAFRTGNLDVSICFAKSVRKITLAEVKNLRWEIETWPSFGELEKKQPKLRSKLVGLLDVLAADSVQISEKDLSTRSELSNLTEELGKFRSAKAVKRIVERHADKAEELLFSGARSGAALLVKAALEVGARLEPDEETLVKRMEMYGKAQRNFSPYPIHNAANAEVLKILIEAGADLSVRFGGEGVLHYMIRVIGRLHDYSDSVIQEGQAMFGLLEDAGVDFAEGANGRTVMQMAAHMRPELRRVLSSIRMGKKISSAMTDEVGVDAIGAPKVSESLVL